MDTKANPPKAEAPTNSKGEPVPNGSGRPFSFVPWILGILACLIVAGVLSSISTAASTGRIDENLRLFRNEARREFDRQQYDISKIEEKLDAHILRTGTNGGGGH
jgi:hypothetical protein